MYTAYLPPSFWRIAQATEIAAVTGVALATARRYKRERDAPTPIRRLLALWLNGRILPDSWENCRFDLTNDRLVVDEIEGYTLGEFRAQFWRNQALELELQQLRARVNRTARPLAVRPTDPAADSPPALRAAPPATPRADTQNAPLSGQRKPVRRLLRKQYR